MDRIDFDASPCLVSLNGVFLIGGVVSVSMRRNDAPPDPLSSKPYIAVDIEGTLTTSYYAQDITSIETRRLFIDDVDVYEENFDGPGDDIVYKFRAGSVRIKYQQNETAEQFEARLDKNG